MNKSIYVIIWEFFVLNGKETEFELHYSPHGTWAAFFQKGDGYIGTELHRDAEQRQRYITIDKWTSEEEYKNFRMEYLDEYASIDARCEALTEKETHLGSFISV